MMAQRRSLWPALLLLVVTGAAVAIYGAADPARRAHGPPARLAPPREPRPAQGFAARRHHEVRPCLGGRGVCVTRHGLCQAPIARAGDPCSCPHLLRGSVPGHVELGGAPARLRSSDWPTAEPPEDELYDWKGLVGP